MTYQAWKSLRTVRGEDAKKVIRDFERNNPYLAAMYERQQAEETEKMRQIMKEPDRMERWKQIAQATYDPEFARRRAREVM